MHTPKMIEMSHLENESFLGGGFGVGCQPVLGIGGVDISPATMDIFSFIEE